MKPYIAWFAIALAGCTNGQADADVTASSVATFPGVSASSAGKVLAAQSHTTDGSVTLDLQKDLASLTQVGTPSATISKNTLAGPDLAVVRHVKATIAAEDGKKPARLVSDVVVPSGSTEVDLPLLIDDAQVLEYLQEGKVALHLYLTTTIPERPLKLTHTMIAHVSLAVSGSVTKL